MSMTVVNHFAAGWCCGPDGTQTFAGGRSPGPGARMLFGACCRDCGRAFDIGERVSAELVADWNAAQWRHEDDCWAKGKR